MKEVRSRWRSMTRVVGYLWPFEHETNKQKKKEKKKCLLILYKRYIVAMRTHLYRLFTQRQIVLLVSQTPPWGNVAYAYILYIPPSFQSKTARLCTLEVKKGPELCRRETLWLKPLVKQMETGPIMWICSQIYINGESCTSSHLAIWISGLLLTKQLTWIL